MQNKTDTHYYDGLIDNTLKYNNIINIDDKKQVINQLLKYINNPISLHVLNILIKDIGTCNNYDNTNNLNVDDLLCLCVQHMNNREFINELELQLSDMINGLCPQGRTHRLYQLLISF